MADAQDSDQKTEAPTAKRRADMKREGDILQSRELGTALMMLAGSAWIALAGPWFVSANLELLRRGLSIDSHDIRSFDPGMALTDIVSGALPPLASLFGITVLAAIAAPAMLGSFGFRSDAMMFKANRINPLSGLKRIFGLHGVIELAKALAKAGLLGALGYSLVTGDLPQILRLNATDIKPALYGSGAMITHVVLVLSLGLVVIAGIDVPIQMIRRNARLRMTKQEIKEEARQSDGAPEMKQAQRQRAHAILSGSARKAVSEATMILTNPTHFAIALRYRPGIDSAPVVVARGRDDVALAIRSMAKEGGVPALEYPQLTRALYFTSRAGHVISQDLYIAVATILAFVFNIERAFAEGIQQPIISVPPDKCFDEHGKTRNT
jgi:flagellar biosynthesis protein FlhB